MKREIKALRKFRNFRFKGRDHKQLNRYMDNLAEDDWVVSAWKDNDGEIHFQ